MALEVGRITARIDAQVADFEKKMTGAQKTFENTSVKMESSAKRTTATLQKTYEERVVAANAAATKEIEAARRTMQERLKLASSTAEITAIRKLFRDRVAAAQAGSAQEVAAAQKAFLAARGPLDALGGGLEELGKKGVRAAPGINSVRSAMTALTASALHTAPGVAQVSSVLGAMALGAPIVIGVLAGIAAITFAWKRLTAAGNELIAAGVAAGKAIESASKSQVDRAKEAVAALKAENTELEKRQRLLGIAAGVVGTVPGLEGAGAFLRGKAQKIGGRLTEIQKQEVLGAKQVTEALKDELEKRLKDQQEAAEKAQREFEKQADEFARIWNRMHQKLGQSPFELLNRVRLQSAGTVEQFAPRRATLLPDDVKQAFLTGLAAAARAAGGAGGGAGTTAPGGNFLKDIFKKFNAKTILSGLATSGISSAINFGIGALTGFADSLFDFSGKAKAAAEAMKKAQADWSKNLDRFILQTTGTDAQKSAADALDTIEEWIAGFEEAFNKGKKLKHPDFKTLDEVLVWAQALLESSFSVDPARAKEWEKFIAAIKVMQTELAKTTDAVNETVAGLINVPNGFKIALARFNATIGSPTLPPSIPSGPRGGPGGIVAPAGNMAARTTYIFEGGITVEASNPTEFLRQLEVEIQRKKLRGGATITLDTD